MTSIYDTARLVSRFRITLATLSIIDKKSFYALGAINGPWIAAWTDRINKMDDLK